ncbi:37S ribosomal protein, mitochondrial [Geranomyces michiganensis]|nr:37S ribosomal protein, mitochondrial [Geranomyces michiganensis]
MTLTVRTLVAANLHLGHARQSWNQNMLPYIYGERQGIHIINLEHTIVMLRRAINVTREIALRGGNILFVGTKPAIHRLTVEAARHADAYFATSWVGGTITNKERVLRRSVGYDPDKVMQTLMPPEDAEPAKGSSSRRGLKAQAAAASSGGEEDSATGRRQSSQGPKNPQPYVHTPDLLIILDYANNAWAVREANQANIPVIAICDTDCNPRRVQYPIPANDDSVTGVELIARALSMASREGRTMRMERFAEKGKEAAEKAVQEAVDDDARRVGY